MDDLTRAARVLEVLAQAKTLAKEYYELTGRPLGITGEVGEYEAARLLTDIELADVRQDGFDALRRTEQKSERLQIKTRCYSKGQEQGQRLGSIKAVGRCVDGPTRSRLRDPRDLGGRASACRSGAYRTGLKRQD